MSAITKQAIIDALRKTAEENGGVPLGKDRLKKETGIGEYDYFKYWPNLSEAQREAGFTANVLNAAHSEEFVFDSVIALMRELNRFPTNADLIVKRNKDNDFPSPSAIQRRGSKKDFVSKISEYAMEKGYNDIVELCKVIVGSYKKEKDTDDIDTGQALGEVYLFKSGRYYKIGKTNDTVRRGNELRIQLPEKMDLIHSIKTDDPSGIEAYWHRRFEAKRMNGEWFDLNSADIKAFKRWRRII
jgi:Meiotically up-regulated gene 113